jgi:hypothetical protein
MNRFLIALIACVMSAFLGFAEVQPQSVARAPKPINLEQLNTDKDEDDPFSASDGLQLYYTSNANGKADILLSTRKSRSQPWPPGKPLDGYIQTKVDDRSLFLTPEGRYPQYLFFATRKDDMQDANFDIYVAVRQTRRAEFTVPTPVNAVCTKFDELHPWLSSDGRQLYFSRKTEEGWRVFVSSRSKVSGAGGFGEAKPVALPVGFHHATLSPNGATMYLQGPLDKNRWGLFRTTRTTSGWAKPEPLTDLNDPDAPTGDRSPCLNWDGSLLYFASDRPGGKGGLDIWVVATADLNKKP